MKTIILVRHGQTQWNVGEKFRGRVDLELNETGIKQAELLAEYLADTRIDAVYSSPLKRTLKTSEIVARRHNLKVETRHELIDLDYGEWQGLSHEEVKDKYKELYLDWLYRPETIRLPGGESLEDVRKRAKVVIDEITSRTGDFTVLLMTHRVVGKVLICALLGLDNSRFWNIRLDNCGVTTFRHADGRFILNEHNNTCFLKTLQKPPLADF